MPLTSQHFATILMLATAGCVDTEYHSGEETEEPLVETACCELPTEVEVENLRLTAEAGGVEASRRLAYYYSALGGREAEGEALRWLEAAAASGKASDADSLVHFHLAHGRCDDANAAFFELSEKVEGYPFPGKPMDREITACFERPVGEGSWQTKRITKRPD